MNDSPNTDRAEIVRRFESLLDLALAAEGEPAGIDPAILSAPAVSATDSYALWAAMTALTQETKLQGRAFQELTRTLEAAREKSAEDLRAINDERERTARRDAERRVRREILSSLIDLRDRLVRGRESVRARESEFASPAPAGWFARTFSKPPSPAAREALSALVRGYELGLERLDQTLAEFNAREIRCLGEIFDPRRMNAIESEVSEDVPSDTVLEVYRTGYEWSGEVFRPAQVKVSRLPAGESE